MEAPRWKKFVVDLKTSGYQSPYLDRLAGRLPTLGARMLGGFGQLELEIAQEMASALGATEDKVNLALLELDVVGKELDEEARRAPGSAQHRALVERYNTKREDALRRRQDLIIHREAVGFRNNAMIPRYYPVPPARRVEG